MSTHAAPDLHAEPERIAHTRRSLEIRRLAAYYDGTQYQGRPDFFTGKDASGKEVPLRERAPCVVYPLPRAACNQATRFTFGEGRYPAIAVAATEDDEVDGSRALSADDAETITRFLADVTEAAGLKSAMRTMLRQGLSQRTAVACLGVKRGRFVLEMPRPADCAVTFEGGDPSAPVERLTWCYSFGREVVVNGHLTTETAYFRRDWTAEEVIAYHDAPLPAPGKPVEWVRDEGRTVRHGLGFCPVVWVRNLPEPHCQEIDGVSIYGGLEDEIDALNFALSQRHRGIVYFGTPQAWEAGVDDGEQPGEVGRTSRPLRTSTALGPGRDPYQPAGGGEAARKTAPDQIWSYQGSDANVGIIETTGAAFDAASKHVLDIRARILEAIDVVLLDPSQVSGKNDLSGQAIARMFAPLLALVDELRDCWWSSALSPLLSMVLRINAALGGRGVLLPRAATVAALSQRFYVTVEGGARLWAPPRMVPSWGAYFSPSSAEVKELVEGTTAALTAGLIRAETAIRNVAPAFGETEVEELAEEADRKAEEAEKAKEEAAKAPASGADPAATASDDDAEATKTPAAKGTKPAKTRPGANALGG